MKKRKPAKKFSLSTWKDYRMGLFEDISPVDIDTVDLSETIVSAGKYQINIKPEYVDIQGEESIVQNQNYDSSASDITIFFDIELEYRSWGIKAIYVTASKAIGSVLINIWGENEDKETEIDISEFELETDVEITSDVVTIQSLIIDVKDRTVSCS